MAYRDIGGGTLSIITQRPLSRILLTFHVVIRQELKKMLVELHVIIHEDLIGFRVMSFNSLSLFYM